MIEDWLDWKWVAAFFDGEGCVNCRESQRPDRQQKLRRQFRLNIYQNTREVLDHISAFLTQEGIDNRVVVHSRPDRVAQGHLGSFMLDVTGAVPVFKMLERVYPFLIVKKDEAGYVIEWLYSLMEEAEGGLLHHIPAKAYGELRKVVG